MSDERWRRVTWIGLAIWSATMMIVAVRGGVQHDYQFYLGQWRLVLDGADPWSTDNAYGPLHNLLAYLLYVGELGPKIVIVSALLAANAFLVRALLQTSRPGLALGLYTLAVPTNVLIISEGVTFGLNDALVAAFVVLALLSRRRARLALAGVALGLAVLLKYYPVVLIPMFAIGTGRRAVRLLASAGITIVAGFTTAILVWRDAFIRALTYASERGAKLLSILAALDVHPDLVGGSEVVDRLIATNMIQVATVATIAVVVAWWRRLHWLEAAVLGLLAVLSTYKVGNQQFYQPWLFLVAALPLAGTLSADRLARVCVPFVLFLSVFQWGYAYGTDQYREVLGVVRSNVGFVSFGLAGATFAAYAWFRSRRHSIVGVLG